MSASEEYLKLHICSCCHVTIMEPHPDHKLRNEHYIKCSICGFTKKLEKKISKVDRIVYGK